MLIYLFRRVLSGFELPHCRTHQNQNQRNKHRFFDLNIRWDFWPLLFRSRLSIYTILEENLLNKLENEKTQSQTLRFNSI